VAAPSKPVRTNYLAYARVALAAAGLAAVCLALPARPWLLVGALGLFLTHALYLALGGVSPSGMPGLLALLLDTVCFLGLASFTAGRVAGLLPAWVLFLFGEALAFHGPNEIAVVTALVALFCGAVPNPALRPVVSLALVGGVLAWACALQRVRQAARAEALRREAEEGRQTVGKTREEERLRIASDFHDGPLQSFISMQMRLAVLQKLLERDFEAGMEDLKELQALAQKQVRDLRAFLNSMRPLSVDGASLVAAARRTVETFQKESGIPVAFQGTNAAVGLPRETATEVLQMLREALHNAQKHAGAARVAVALEKADGALEISVDDNGRGFPFSGCFTLEELELLRLGPASLKRRARGLNAEMTLDSRPGRGVGLKIRVPLP
jgi:signal transduction histidine kinase